MYSVIEVGGNQYKVNIGDVITVDRLDEDVGIEIKFPSLLVVNGKDVKLSKDAATVAVHAKVLEHDKGEKIDILRFRAKSRHRRRVGFRPYQTKIQILSIGEPVKVQSDINKKAKTDAKVVSTRGNSPKRVTK